MGDERKGDGSDNGSDNGNGSMTRPTRPTRPEKQPKVERPRDGKRVVRMGVVLLALTAPAQACDWFADEPEKKAEEKKAEEKKAEEKKAEEKKAEEKKAEEPEAEVE